MFLKNTSVRLITINLPGGASYPLIPDETKEIKGEIGIAQEFIDSLIGLGELTEVAAPKAETKTETKK